VSRLQPAKVLLCQSIGFLAIIFVCLFDELLGLSVLIFGNHSCIVDLRDFTLKMLLILCVWLLVSGSTRRILDQTHHLSRFMKVCAWCRRIQYEGCWMPLEKFLRIGFDKPTSHAICEDCFQKAQVEIQAAKQSNAQVVKAEPETA